MYERMYGKAGIKSDKKSGYPVEIFRSFSFIYSYTQICSYLHRMKVRCFRLLSGGDRLFLIHPTYYVVLLLLEYLPTLDRRKLPRFCSR
jgi:hypothetical protein